jgi:DNA primase
MLKQFYEKVLPAQGVYCITGINKNKGPINRFADTLDELETIVNDLLTRNTNVFVAPGSFKNHSRRAENGAFMRSFFIDLDVGDNKGYETKQEALEAIGFLLEETKLPTPAVVDSGGGIHAYWVLDKEIPVEQWKPYAERFKRKVQELIPIDPVVTADIARIMRAPGTLNYKYDPPLPP